MSDDGGKRRVRDFIEAVWVRQDFDALDGFWTADCINHAAPPGHDAGLVALRAYHEQFAAQFSAFSDTSADVIQQIADNGKVVTHLLTRGRHTGEFAGVAPTGRAVTLATIRIDRLENGMIAEHWSVADIAGLLHQLTE